MVQEPVPHSRLVNIAWFRIAYLECFVAAVPIHALSKFSIKGGDISYKIP
jgi:hypothetical protein